MKRISLLLIIMAAGFGLGWAQSGLAINALFDGRYRNLDNATEIVVTGQKARSISLNAYHSLTITGDAAAERLVTRLVAADGAKAKSKDVEYRAGGLYYGFYELQPVRFNNRYIFFLNQNLAKRNPEDKVILIYMEGNVSAKYIKSLIGQ